MKEFDVIILGTGSGGTSVAYKCAAAGRKVAIIDLRPYGGTCALRGCDPKKVLVGISHALSLSHQLENKGIITTAIGSWKDLMQFKKTFTDPVPDKNEAAFKKAGIATYHGKAFFTSEQTLQVDSQILHAKMFLLATGAKPRVLSIPGEQLLIDSTAFLELEELPKEIILVGGGYIAFEFAHLASRFGSKVKILHRGDRALKAFDPDLVNHLVKATESLGIEVMLNTEVTALKREGDKIIVNASSSGKDLRFSTSLAVHAAGRTADIEDLNLEKINVAFDKKGISVNEYMQSVTNPNVYASGDVNNKGLPLTPVAAKESVIVATNLLKGNHAKIDYGHIPSNVFTTPPLASVGLTEADAKHQGKDYKVNYKEITDWFSYKRLNEPVAAYKTLLDKETDEIIGAHLLGHNAEEIINIFTVAMNLKLTGNQLKKTIFSYPTNASDIPYMV
jgi:glutathione reductase (NADPH)